jgi:hypothetical protein
VRAIVMSMMSEGPSRPHRCALVRLARGDVALSLVRAARQVSLVVALVCLHGLTACGRPEPAACRPPLAPSARAQVPAPNLCVAGGARLCGGECGPCDDTSCLVPRSPEGQVADVAVCFGDLADRGDRLCSVCGDGEACLYRSPRQLVCVPDELCQALAARGAAHLCRFTDKSSYDAERPIASTSAECPHPSLCGGCCGDCEQGGACVGRSPTRPFGVCADREGPRPLWRQACAVVDHYGLQGYPVGFGDCMAFVGADVDREAALTSGLVVPNCDELVAAGYPVECY